MFGLLLVNLGTPNHPDPKSVRTYLREFLSDPRVLTIPGAARWLLLNAVILPTRPKKSAEAYQQIWTDEGSPLLVYGRKLEHAVAEKLGTTWQVELAMRYGQPTIEDALKSFDAKGVDQIMVLPLYPQYASSSTGSTLEKIYKTTSDANRVVQLNVIPEFYDEPLFIEAHAAVARPIIDSFQPDHVMFSYHGLPENHMRDVDASGTHCLASNQCCDSIQRINRRCYRAQCFATTRLLVEALALPSENSSIAFQSRLGRQPWIKPYTDEELPKLAAKGVKKLAIMCPAFVADCLETLEEIGIRARDDWQACGGTELQLIPSLNASPAWIHAVASMAMKHAPTQKVTP